MSLLPNLTNAELLRLKHHFVNGQWCAPGGPETFDVLNPATSKAWTTLQTSSLADVEQAIGAAEAAFKTYAHVPSRQRARWLLAFDQLLRANLEDVARLLVYETGKPLAEARGEVEYALSFSWWFVGEAERAATGQTIRSATNADVRFFTITQPIGPVALLMPWNFPVALFVRKAATALAAGCTIVAKPSPETPLSTLAVARLMQQAGFPDGTVNVVLASNQTTPAVGQLLCQDRRIKKVSFTGSTAVGRLLMAQCAPNLKKLTLELGGLGACLIFDDADLDRAADHLVGNKFRHAGQTCITMQRTYVHESVAERLVERILSRMASFKMGSGLEDGVNLGPVETQRGQDKAIAHIRDAEQKGARVHQLPAITCPSVGFFVAPTLLTGCTADMLVYQEETFGPVLALSTFTTEDEVIARANDTTMGLTSYVFTQDAARLWRAYEQLKAGNVGLNTGTTTSAEVPFGGVDQSGFGKEAGIGAGMAEYQVIKSATMLL